MGAFSVTGVGPGGAMPNVKGQGNNRNLYIPALTPHVIKAGIMTVSGTPANNVIIIKVPVANTAAEGNIANTVNDFAAFATSTTITSALSAGIVINGLTNGYLTLTLSGTTSDVVNWAVIRVR
jgi:hypothetical protein